MLDSTLSKGGTKFLSYSSSGRSSTGLLHLLRSTSSSL